jgi:hypothetical protein
MVQLSLQLFVCHVHSNEPAGSHGISIRGKAGLHGFSPCSTFNIQHFSFFTIL